MIRSRVILELEFDLTPEQRDQAAQHCRDLVTRVANKMATNGKVPLVTVGVAYQDLEDPGTQDAGLTSADLDRLAKE